MGEHRGDRRSAGKGQAPDPGPAGGPGGHGHGHGPAPDLEIAWLPRVVLFGVLALVAVGVVVGGVLLWPDGHKVDKLQGSVGFAAPGVTFPDAVIDKVEKGQLSVTVEEGTDKGTKADVQVPPEVGTAGLASGDKVELVRTPGQPGQPATFAYFGIQRDHSLWLLTALFVIVVIAVARLRGLMALIGLAVAGVVGGWFVLPALITGEHAVPVALVGAVAIMYVVLYTTHGVSIRTSAALAGTLGGLVVTAAVAWWAVTSAHLTGVADEGGTLLTTYTPDLNLQSLLVAAVIIAGLGVLNDVTTTQASAVWELRAASPFMTRARLFASAMRIGRDHVASTIYTIVFAYAGISLTLLLVISLYDRPWIDLVTTEQIAEEVVRSMVGAVGLILAMPITTAIAVLTVPVAREPWSGQTQ